MPTPIQPSLFIMCDLYPLISRTNLSSSVSQNSVTIIKVTHFLTRFKLVTKSANLPVFLKVLAVREDKNLSLSFLSSSDHNTLVLWEIIVNLIIIY